ncbi:MAG TPA: archease [Nitrospirae bacterium]|nr:archease [Nitrospirota bacterium]
MEEPGYEVLDISGDVGLKVRGETLEELFINGALGLYSLVTDLSRVKPEKSINVNVYSESIDGLFVSWLNEIIFQFDTYGFIGREIEIESLNENRIEAKLKGEDFDPDRHEKGLLLKAATYHNLKIEKRNGVWTAEVIFDI